MKYLWEVWIQKPFGRHMLWSPTEPRWADVEDADSAQAIADRIAPQLLPGQRLNVWNTLGVGKPPILTVDGK